MKTHADILALVVVLPIMGIEFWYWGLIESLLFRYLRHNTAHFLIPMCCT
jgi:hypothetical protein